MEESQADFDADFDIDDGEERERARFRELLPAAFEAAKSAKFEPEIKEDDWGDQALWLIIPSGRNQRTVALDSSDELERFIALDHSDFVFIDGLEALAFFKEGQVEVGLQSVGIGSPRSGASLFQRTSEGQIDRNSTIELPDPKGEHDCQIGKPSDIFRLFNFRYDHSGVTLKVKLASVRGNDLIRELLVKVTNSLFLQIDLLTNQAPSMARARTIATKGRAFRRKSFSISDLNYPQHEYEDAPCSLYWYGRSAAAMPLLQFLAFYQVVEFFYPVHSKAELNRRLRLILNDPSFRPDRDSDLTKLAQSLTPNRSGGIMDERSQLKAALNECTTSEDIRAFLSSTEEKCKFYQEGFKVLHKTKISLDEKAGDIRPLVAERLYGIRCRIVHTKDDGSEELGILLPYTKEEAALAHDIELMQFVARSVLVASGVRLH